MPTKPKKRSPTVKRWSRDHDPLFGLFQKRMQPLEIAKPKRFDLPISENMTKAERAHWQTACYLHGLAGYAYSAIFENDPHLQGIMRDHAMHHLLAGERVPEPVRAWLLYLLTSIRKLPREGTGPSFDRTEYWRRYQKLSEACRTSPTDEPITTTLKSAADNLNISYEVVRALYYSDAFMLERVITRRERDSKIRKTNK